MGLKNLAKQMIPQGICDYSIRRHEYMRMGIHSGRASWIGVSPARYRNLCESRLNLLPCSILSNLKTCVDAGAHAGSWTHALIENFPPPRIIAVECEPRLLAPLKAKFSQLPFVEVVEAALAGSEGTATFHQLRHPAGSSLLKPRADVSREFEANSWDVVGTVDVRKITYDQLVAREDEVSILKLDIQGAEHSVLENSRDGLEKTKSILMEVMFTPHYENDAGFPELHQLMAKKGLGLYRLSPPYHRGGRILFADALYIREDILRNLSPD